MARVKVTSSDINARLAKSECANYLNGRCQGRTPCTVVEGESCQYFSEYVRPLLDHADVAQRYSREAKIRLALNPEAKVVRKRRQAGAPTLALETTAPPTKPASAAKRDITTAKQTAPTRAAKKKPAQLALAPAAVPPPAKAAKRVAHTAAADTPPAPRETPELPRAERKSRQRQAAVEAAPPVAVTAPVPAKTRKKTAATPEAAPALELTSATALPVKRSKSAAPPVEEGTAKRKAAAKPAPVEEMPQLELVLDLTPAQPTRRRAGARR